MKKVSANMFFTVMWRGLCQTLGYVFGLFGYKRNGKFAKCVWGLFATSSAVIVAIIAISLLWCIGDELYNTYKRHNYICENSYCYANNELCHDIWFHGHHDGKGYVYNRRTGEKLIENIVWIAEPLGKDTLVCFSDGKKRGYFSKNTGKVVIEPKYDHAWIFSDGLASVDEGGQIKFIDALGNVVIDKDMAYIPYMDGYVFHGGYCVVDTDEGDLCGLMDKTGEMLLPLEYSSITLTDDCKLWRLRKGEETAVVTRDLKPVIPFMEGTFYIGEGTIDVTMPDHTMRKYDYQGNLINDFYISNFQVLEYEKEEIKYEPAEFGDSDDSRVEMASYHPKTTARLRAYTAGDGYEGLMTAEGHLVTMPLYQDIEAIGADLYLCTSTNYDKVIVNGKGELVR